MERLILKRAYYLHDATYGLLIDPQLAQIICLTLELPWRFNVQNISCVPNGIYICRRYLTTCTVLDDNLTYILEHVPNRHGIVFHIGNTIEDTEGCVLTGSEFGVINNYNAVLRSKDAFIKFMDWTDNIDKFELRIEN